MNILLINNESEIQRMLIKIIEKWRGNVMAVTTTSDAIRAIQDGTFDLVVSESSLLDIRKDEIKRKIRKSINGTPIIIVSDNILMDTALEFIEAGAWRYFIGSFSSKEIQEELNNFVRTREISELNKALKGGKEITKNTFIGNSRGVVREAFLTN